jgi:hypothetical protein
MTMSQPSSFGSPAARAPVDPRTAMHGLSNADVETRYPFLTPPPTPGQPGFNYQLKLVTPRLIQGQRIGLAWFLECEVLQSSDPNSQPNASGQPTMRAVKIDGFSSIKAKKFAESDLKQALALLLAPEFKAWGIDVNWKPSAEDIAAGKTWENLCAHVLSAENPAAGRTFGASTALTQPGEASGKSKMKCLFFAA